MDSGASTPPDPRPFGGAEGMVLTDAREMAFVLAMGWAGAVDMQVNIDKPQLAKILRQIADKTDSDDAERAFIDASVAVWREVDRLEAEGPYPGIPPESDLRQRERAAWEAYKAVLDA